MESKKLRIGGLAALPLGMVFVIAGMGKLLLGLDTVAFPPFVPPVIANALFTSLPYIELVIGGLLILGIGIKFMASVSALLIIGFAVTNIFMLRMGVEECVSCFGAPLTPTTALIMDGIMATLVAVILSCYHGGFFNKTPWFLPIKRRECEYV